MVKISAYDFSIYGGLEARVEQISADTIEDRKGEYYYLVKLRTQKNAINYRNEQLPAWWRAWILSRARNPSLIIC